MEEEKSRETDDKEGEVGMFPGPGYATPPLL
jgi:hypothetical protein